MAALGLAIGLTVVPQQHRLFATVPALAPIAVGLNGSTIYIGSALGAAAGGLALTVGGSNAPTIVPASSVRSPSPSSPSFDSARGQAGPISAGPSRADQLLAQFPQAARGVGVDGMRDDVLRPDQVSALGGGVRGVVQR